MSPSSQTIRRLLDGPDFKQLFIEELGWDRHEAQLPVSIDGVDYSLQGIAQKRGFAAFVCRPGDDGQIPGHHLRSRIDHEVTKAVREHLIIFVDDDMDDQLWQWVRRGKDQPIARREYPWQRGQQSGMLLERVIPSISFSFEEEHALSLVDVTQRAESGFDVEKVTKRFYDHFQREHKGFLDFITGIREMGDREWYASVMLNRLMFCYFVQKKGLLDGDYDYLSRRLALLQSKHGKGKFWSFYKHFLLRLFHEGLSVTPSERASDMDALIGQIPYLNGGLFLPHEIEEKYGARIEIPDEAFERIFSFFDEFRWHLDERPLRDNNEINPDVLGYIFEKYINQKQMGAYYTKEDITGYIAQNTILPLLIDRVAEQCPDAFSQNGSNAVWSVLARDPERYIYESTKYGVIDDQGGLRRLPAEISPGVKDVTRRQAWNGRPGSPYCLQTETWREYIDRRRRCLDTRKVLKAGRLKQIDDLISLNVDIRQFVEDVIASCENQSLLWTIWQNVEQMAVLDPTCGSGAFLFAALNVLEPLYDACLDRMDGFVREEGGEAKGGQLPKFKQVLARVAEHPNRRYFVLKSIMVNNLFGVDIMEEAAEICKLRLFLKLVAQVDEGNVKSIEPLPDIDFNIRAGNALVGFTTLQDVEQSMSGRFDFEGGAERIRKQAESAAEAFRRFRALQTTAEHSSSLEAATSKGELRERLRVLDEELNGHLAADYGIDPDKAKQFDGWKESHQPFHWLVDFYDVMTRGGFDVIIGNPPYVASKTVSYLSAQDKQLGLPDLYAYVLLRTLTLSHPSGRSGMIVPLSLSFSGDFAKLRKRLSESGCGWYSAFDNIPAALFSGVSQRCTIWIGKKGGEGRWASPLYRWRSITRPYLFHSVEYTSCDRWVSETEGLPRLCGANYQEIAEAAGSTRIASSGPSFALPARRAKQFLSFAPAARNFMSAYIHPPPCLNAGTLEPVATPQCGQVGVPTAEAAKAALAICVGEYAFLYWLTYGDGFHVTVGNVAGAIEVLSQCESVFEDLVEIGGCLDTRRFEALVFKKNAGKYVGNYNYRGHAFLTRRADLLVMIALGLGCESVFTVFDHVQRMLAINESAGEKGIPSKVKAKYPPAKVNLARERAALAKIDRRLEGHFGFSSEELEFILMHDVAFGQ